MMNLKKTERDVASTALENNESKLSLSFSLVEAKPRQIRGFTLLLAVLISGILLALGFAIFNIVSKELILSSSGRESQFAFYAADTGVECALYWDYKKDAFSSELIRGEEPIPVCGGGEVTYQEPVYGSEVNTYEFSFSLGTSDSDPCTTVTVERKHAPFTATTIISSGFNTCVTTNPRRLERTIRVQY